MIKNPAATRTLLYVLSNMASKGMVAVAQIYAIFVFTRMHTHDDAAVIFILLGYAIWFQVFELGLAQTLQNKFNAKLVSSSDVLEMLMFQFLFVLTIALIVVSTPLLANLLLSDNRKEFSAEATAAFSTGAAILVIASNNVITQRLLLVLNRGQLANLLMISQALLTIIGLAAYTLINKPNLEIAVVLYLGPQVFVYLPILAFITFRLINRSARECKNGAGGILRDSLRFWGSGIISILYIGLDYYFAAHYLSAEKVVSFHLVSRLFFVSYVIYYSFVQYQARHLTSLSTGQEMRAITSLFKHSTAIGFASVLTIFLLAIGLESLGKFAAITNGVGIDLTLLYFAFLYFSTRSFRDVAVVIAGGLNARNVLYMVYIIELTVGLIFLPMIVPTYGGPGIFATMSVASILGLISLIYYARKINH